jgi:hypothetical protein
MSPIQRRFNTTGPCVAGEHYMLPAQERCADLMPLVEQKSYFVIHAARQSGKTTMLLDFVKRLNGSGRYYALYCSLETIQGITDEAAGIRRICARLQFELEFDQRLASHSTLFNTDDANTGVMLEKSLGRLCAALDRPVAIMFDEADCLSNGTLISFLRQLRNGYVQRPQHPFLASLALVGMRDIRDYKGKIREDASTLGSASPFNIVKDSLTLRNFTLDEIAGLYGQHAADTGQTFPRDAVDRAFYLTQGQPWLVNAVAMEIVERILGNDTSRAITALHVDEAAERIVIRRDTHIDSLLERLKEERVQRIIEPILTGASGAIDRLNDDFAYCSDLGLVRIVDGKARPANPIYAEVIARTLSYRSQTEMAESSIPPALSRYISSDGLLDMNAMLADFQKFWRENSSIWVEKYQYKEAAPLLVLQAFLQRVLNGGGSINREFAAGRGRTDLCIDFSGKRYVVELKIRRDARAVEKGVEQLAEYLDTLGEKQGWLVVFDRRPRIAWKQKLFTRARKTRAGHTIRIFGC